MQLLQNGKQQWIDQNGLPLANGTVGYYAPGTLNPQATYQDQAGTIANTNPITLDSRGQAIVWGTGTYRQIVKDASGVTIWDQVVDTPAGGAAFSNSTGAGGAGLIGFDGGTVASFFLSKSNRVVDTIAALRALSKTTYTRAFVTGYYAAGDGGGGPYWYDPTDTTTADNGGTIIVAADGGRWKLTYKDAVNVKQFGAKTDGTATSAQIQAAFNSGVKSIYVAGGDYTIDTTLTPPTSMFNLRFDKNARFVPAANNLTIIKSTVSAYYFRCESLSIYGNGKTGVIGMDMTGMRLYSGLLNCHFQNIDTGFIGRDGCFGLYIENLTCEAVNQPLNLLSNNSGTTILNPNFDNGSGVGGTGHGVGISIDGTTSSNLGVIIMGGYVQGFDTGIYDNGRGTSISDIYIENCLVADVNSTAAIGSRYSNVSHWASTGPAAYRLRNTDGVMIWNPMMGSGARTAMFDVDSSNTNCAYYLSDSTSSANTPTGSVAFMSPVVKQVASTFTPVVTGSSTSGVGTYTAQVGTVTKMGNQVHVQIAVGWTAHTGTGNITITGLPAALAPSNGVTLRRVGSCGVSGIAFTGPMLYAYFTGSGTTIGLIQVSTAGSESLVALPGSGTIYVNIVYDL